MESTAVECTPGEIGGKPPDSNPSHTQAETAPVMHTLQPVMTGPGGEQLGHFMQPPMSMPMSMPVMMSPYQMMVFPQAVQASGSPALQAQGSPAPGDSSSRSGTPAGQQQLQQQQQQQHAMAVFSQGLPISHIHSEQQAQLIQAVAATHVQQQQQQDNGHSVTQSPVPQGSAHGSPAPATPSSLGSPMPPVMGEGIQQVSGIPLQLAQGLPMGMQFQTQVPQTPETPKEDPKTALKPPKKPLTPYMRFSKSIWQQVKAANQGMSVCEIGATIGRMWRELGDTDKQHYNEEFTQAKARYDEELQNYLKLTGLQASDLVKSKKKKDTKEKRQSAAAAAAQNAAAAAATAAAQNNSQQVQPQQQFLAPGATGANVNGPMTLPFLQGNAVVSQALAGHMGALPHFSQVWTGQQQYGQQVIAMASMPGFTNGEGGGEGMVPVQQVQVQSTDGTVLYSQIPAGLATTTVTTTQPQNTQVVSSESGGAPEQRDQWQWQEGKDVTTTAATDILSQAAAVSSISPAVTQPGEGQPPTPKEEGGGEKVESSQAGQYPSAHTLYNSYGYNPWSAYPAADPANAKPEGVGKPVVSEREKALETEISHLKAALTERTKEVKRLEQELNKAYDIIERLHQQQSQGGPGTPQQSLSGPATPQTTQVACPTPPESTGASTTLPVATTTTSAGMVTSSSEIGEVSSMLANTQTPSTTAN